MASSVFRRLRLRAAFGACGAGTVACAATAASRRPTLEEELEKLRPIEAELRAKWIKDDQESWKRLPPRAWPAHQPTAAEVPALRERLVERRCPPAGDRDASAECVRQHFDIATAQVFNNLDGDEGVRTYKALAEAGDLDGMVATGVCCVEGLGVARHDAEGLKWLRRAVDLGSAQGLFELATLTYTGEAGVQEDESAAFQLFERAAAQNHASGLFMVADCLLEGIGCERDQARAVPLLLQAANSGHRGARQHLRQLLDGNWHSFETQVHRPDPAPWQGQDLPSAR